MERFCGRDAATLDGLVLLESENTSMSSRIDIGVNEMAAVRIPLGADSLGGHSTHLPYTRTAVDHITICLRPAIAERCLSDLKTFGPASQIRELTSMSKDISIASVAILDCEFHIVAPTTSRVPLFEELLGERPLGGIQHIAIAVSNLAEFVLLAEEEGIVSLRTKLRRMKRLNPFFDSIISTGFCEDRKSGGTLRQTFLYPGGRSDVMAWEIVERNDFLGYSETNAKVLFEAANSVAMAGNT